MSADFLSRWSRRKSEAKETASAPPEAPTPETAFAAPIEGDAGPPEDAVERPSESIDEITAEEIAELPAVEELTFSSDLAPFLRAGVPTLLRNAALRRMWTVDPGIRDFLNDAREYAYDWNTPGGVPGLGPMLPTDDVKAMVRRIFDGPIGRADAQEEIAFYADERADHEASDVEDEAPAALTDETPGPKPASAPIERPLSPVPAPADAAAADAKPAAAPDRAAGAGLTRPRRHGGATPA